MSNYDGYDPLMQRPVNWFDAGMQWKGTGPSMRPGTLEEKLDALAALAAMANEPFNRKGMRRDLKGGKERGPFIGIDGTSCRTAKLRDKYNNDFRAALWAGTKDFEWAFKELEDFDVEAWKANRTKEQFIEFEDAWQEARQELIDAGQYTFEDGVLREVPIGLVGVRYAFVTFELQRPGFFARVRRALSEAFRG